MKIFLLDYYYIFNRKKIRIIFLKEFMGYFFVMVFQYQRLWVKKIEGYIQIEFYNNCFNDFLMIDLVLEVIVCLF